MLGPVLETARLILRPPHSDDFEAFAAFSADPEIGRFLGGVQTRTGAWRSLSMLIGAWTLRGFSMFSILEKRTRIWVGRAGPWFPEGWPGREVGWAIAPHAQRRGFGAEAARALIDWTFTQLGWSEVVHCIDPRNLPSIALARSIGSDIVQRDVEAPAPIMAKWDLYGQTRAQWAARWPAGTTHWTRVN